MKNYLIIILMTIFPILTNAQTKGEQLHTKYGNEDGFTTFSLSGSFLKDLDFDVDDDEIEKKITGDIHTMKFLTYKRESNTQVIDFFRIAQKQLSQRGYDQVLEEQTKDSDDETLFFARGKGRRYSEFHVLHSSDNRTSLVSFFGNFKVDDLKALSRMGREKVSE